MPWYDYQCEKCGTVFEVQRSMSADGPVRCKQCGSTKTSKIFNAAGIQFKGSGFYVNDARGSNAAATPGAATDSEPAPAADKKPSKPADAKPASKSAKPDGVPAAKST